MLKKGEKKRERGVRIHERNNSADTNVSDEGGRGGAPGTTAEIPLQPMKTTMVGQAVPPAVHEGPWWSRSPPAAQGGPHAGAGGYLKEAVNPWGVHAGGGSWQDM